MSRTPSRARLPGSASRPRPGLSWRTATGPPRRWNGAGHPGERAQFLAIRQGFIEEWQPRGGLEQALIDSLAQAYASYLFWMERLHVTATTEAERHKHQLKTTGRWEAPRVEPAAWIEEAAGMADRFNRLFLRTLRQLRDLRRYAPAPVVVQSAGQVNIGGQQVNVQSDAEAKG